jgi:RNA polymerase sigma factor (sigma-70 family)
VASRSEATSTATFSELAAEAASGSEAAWRELCGRLRNVVWKTIRAFGVYGADADDAYAATMFRLAEHLGRIRDPERLPGWIATTARNEALATFRARRRVVSVAEVPEPVGATDADTLVRGELHEAVRRAFALMDERCQRLLRLLTADPPPSYDVVGELLAMPHGSIGPTRRRCLEGLRAQPPLRDFLAEPR